VFDDHFEVVQYDIRTFAYPKLLRCIIRSLCVPLSFTWLAIVLSVSSIYGVWLPLWFLQTCDHCIFYPSSIYRFWLPLGYLQMLLCCKTHQHLPSSYQFVPHYAYAILKGCIRCWFFSYCVRVVLRVCLSFILNWQNNVPRPGNRFHPPQRTSNFILGYSAGFTIVLRCAQGPIDQGGHLPANFFNDIWPNIT